MALHLPTCSTAVARTGYSKERPLRRVARGERVEVSASKNRQEKSAGKRTSREWCMPVSSVAGAPIDVSVVSYSHWPRHCAYSGRDWTEVPYRTKFVAIDGYSACSAFMNRMISLLLGKPPQEPDKEGRAAAADNSAASKRHRIFPRSRRLPSSTAQAVPPHYRSTNHG